MSEVSELVIGLAAGVGGMSRKKEREIEGKLTGWKA
jgi:hypothetical protein